MAVLIQYHLRAFALACGLIAVVAVSGCRNLDNAQTDVLERELRQQEDYIYELEDYLIEYSEKLRHARMAQCPPGMPSGKSAGTTAPRTPLREPTLDEDPVIRPTLPLNGRNKLTPPPAPAGAESTAPPANTELTPTEAPPAEPTMPPAAEEVDPETLEAPELQIGPVGATPSDTPAMAASSSSDQAEGPLLIPDPVDYQADTESLPAESAAASEMAAAEPELAAPQINAPRLTATELKIRKIFTQPAEDEKSPGSLLVVVEAVNATDEPGDAVGAASIMVMTRDESGKPQKVERWDFTAEETAAAWQSSHLGDGLHLELPLTKPQLPEGELELWARVVADDGAKLLTSANEPCRFEAAKLASLADSASESSLASTEQLEPTPVEDSSPVTTTDTAPDTGANAAEVAETPKSKWRASTVQLNDDRVEAFATTAGNKPASWTTKPIDGAAPRVASAAVKSNSPKWKRSTRASAESTPAWSAER